MPKEEIEEVTETCPYCGKPVTYKWHVGKGFISEPHNDLIADWVYHSECWDKLVAEHPPGEESSNA